MPDLPTYEHPDDASGYLPGEFILRVHPDAVRPHLGVDRPQLVSTHAVQALPDSVVEPIAYLRRNAGLMQFGPALSVKPAIAGLGWPSRFRQSVAASVLQTDLAPFAGLTIGRLPQRNLTSKLLRDVGAARAIDRFERVPKRWLTSTAAVDPERNLQWGLRAIRWFRADLPDASGIRVGLIDSGIDRGHPAFEGLAVDYSPSRFGPTDVVGHGTHVAGLVGSLTDNESGITGMARPTLSVWKVLPNEPNDAGRFVIVARPYLDALYEAATANLTVLNLSLAGIKPADSVEQDAIAAVRATGANVVAAMGNGHEKGNPTMYPASYDGVFAVGSMREDGHRSTFSGVARYIDLVAPGSNVLSVVPRRRSKHRSRRVLDVQSGTSMATAYASGALALLAAERPELSNAEREERLRITAHKLRAMRGRAWTQEHGYGLLDVRAALSS